MGKFSLAGDAVLFYQFQVYPEARPQASLRIRDRQWSTAPALLPRLDTTQLTTHCEEKRVEAIYRDFLYRFSIS